VVVANLVKEEPSSESNVDGDRAARSDGSSEQSQDYFAVRNPAVRNQLVAEHSELAYRLARKFIGRGEPYDDLVQVAFIGLIEAIERFDPHRGGTLASFAVPTILGELKRHFRDPELVKHFETRSCYAVCATSSVGSLIQATVGSFGGSGRRWRNRLGFAA
jgi:hypothetical protein